MSTVNSKDLSMSASFSRNAAVGLGYLWLAASVYVGTASRTYTPVGQVASTDLPAI